MHTFGGSVHDADFCDTPSKKWSFWGVLENFGSGGGIKKKRRNDTVFRPQSFHHTLGCILGSHNRLPLYIGRSPSSVPHFYTSTKINTMSIIIIGPPLRKFNAPTSKIAVPKHLQNHKFRPIFVSKWSISAHFQQKTAYFRSFCSSTAPCGPENALRGHFYAFQRHIFSRFLLTCR